MAEENRTRSPTREQLRRAVRHELRRTHPGWRVLCEGWLAASSEIDLLALGPRGEWQSIRIDPVGGDDSVLTHALSDLEWLRRRASSLRELAPEAGIDPTAQPGALLVATDFSSVTQLAATHLVGQTIELRRLSWTRRSGGITARLEADARTAEPLASSLDRETPPATDSARRSQSAPTRRSHEGPPPPLPRAARTPAPFREVDPPLTDPPCSSSFRTGLCDADLATGPPQSTP